MCLNMYEMVSFKFMCDVSTIEVHCAGHIDFCTRSQWHKQAEEVFTLSLAKC